MIAPTLLVRRLSLAIAIAIACAYTASLTAQIPTRNVNMVSGLVWPIGDPFLQRQNEPSTAASTRNPLHLLAGSNDYRSVDLPLVLSDVDGEVGDAWLGLYKSTDGGERWTSTLLPGYPHDPSLEGLTSPIRTYHAAADPVVRAGTNGLLYYAGLAFDRTPAGSPPGKSAIFVSRFIDNNNQEAGDPIEYINTSLVFSSPGGATNVFLDKPWMAVDIPRAGAGTCAITTNNEHGPFTQRPLAGNVYVAFTVKSIDAQGDRWDLYFSRSTNCGALFSAPIRVSRVADRVNQGATIVIAPNTGAITIAWRRIDLAADGEEDHAIVVARSTDFGVRWDPPGVARRFPRGKKKGLDPEHFQDKGKKKNAVVSQTDATVDLVPFDQGSSASGLAFRTNAYPTMAADATGRLYLAWTERRLANDPTRPELTDGDARILLSTSADGATWSDPIVVHDVGQLGHQIMPALSFAGGKLMVAYYDLQEDRSAVFTRNIDDQTAFARTSPDRRHTIDIRASMAAPGAAPVFEPSRSVSTYMMGARGPSGLPEQMQVNPPNLPLFKLGTTPFIGDYIDIAPSPAFVPNGSGGWIYNTASTTTPPVFHVAWTDNRDVKPPIDRDWTKYTPPNYSGLRPEHASGEVVEVCLNGYAGTRNQNIYTARVTGGLIVGSPQNSKPLNTQFARAFVVFARNTTDTLAPRVFRMTILNQPVNGRASFSQFPAPPFGPGAEPPLTSIDVTVPRLSSASRTVYVTSSDSHAPVNVDVSEITAVGGSEIAGGLEGTIYLNLDIANPEVDNPEVDNPEVDNPEVDNAEVYNPEVDNPEVDNPEVDNPEVDNPEVDNPEVDNPEVDNIEVGNPEVDNPEVDNPEVDNPEVDNPEVDNPEVDNGAILEGGGVVTDITWKVRNIGNTTTAYNVNLFLRRATLPRTGTAQLLIYRVYQTPIIRQASCDVATTTQNVLQVNIPSPTLVLADGDPSDPNDSDENHATMWLEPGGEIIVDLRVSDPDTSNNIIIDGASIDPDWVPQQDVFLTLQAQPVDTPDIPPGSSGPIEPPPVTADPVPPIVVTTAANSGAGSLREAITTANAQPGPNTITFNIPGATPHTIALATLLPQVDEAVIIDGSTQPGYAGAPVIQVDGTAIIGGGAGFRLRGGGSLVRGLSIGGFGDHGIWMDSNANEAYGNYVGVDVTGNGLLQNGTSGVPIGGIGNIVGSMAPGDRNVISGSSFVGVIVDGTNNTIAGNYIGTNAAGTAAIPQIYGVALTTGGSNIVSGNTISGNMLYGVAVGTPGNTIDKNRIGVTASGLAALPNDQGVSIGGVFNNRLIGNVISGNTDVGINVFHSAGLRATGTEIIGNYIGTDPTGMAAIPNRTGIAYGGVELTVLGGPGAGRNVISGNLENGVTFTNDAGLPSSRNVVQNNFIGVNAAGTGDLGNGFVGLMILNSSNNTIGGPLPGEGNVISGNDRDGISIGATALPVDNTVIVGNMIGTSADGLAAIPNLVIGVFLTSVAPGSATNTRIGGPLPAERNIISGNLAQGVFIAGDATTTTTIENNYVGVGADGAINLGNGSAGVVMMNLTTSTIGTAAGPNVMSGNGAFGLQVVGSSDTSVAFNIVGTNAAGTAAVGNQFGGIYFSNTTNTSINNNVISGNIGSGMEFLDTNGDFSIRANHIGTNADDSILIGNIGNGISVGGNAGAATIGVTGQANTIRSNGGIGIQVAATANTITIGPNIIFNNAGLEIDLEGDGVTANDLGDGDGGGNQRQNYPVITGANQFGPLALTTVTGTLNSTALTAFTVRLFISQFCDPSGFGGGQSMQQTYAVVTNAAGDANFIDVLSGIPLDWYFTATATDPAGNTSEFSQCRQVVTP